MREYRLNAFAKVLYLMIVCVLILILSAPIMAIQMLLGLEEHALITFCAFIVSATCALIISEVYTSRHPLRIRVEDDKISLYSLFRHTELYINNIVAIKLYKRLGSGDYGAEYSITVNIDGRERKFFFAWNAICNLDEFIRVIQSGATNLS